MTPQEVSDEARWFERARLRKLLEDDALADRVAGECRDPAHDERWCSTCSARQDGINDYRRALLARLDEEAMG